MSLSDQVFKNGERAIYNLRALYRKNGYSLYKVSKFEEYDLYARNKSFLVSQSILSFTDTNGKLLALKPDVTLSIVKNIPDDSTETHKLCYNENVYRTAGGSDGFREIMQTGLECIGTVDLYAEYEVVRLAIESLKTVSDSYLLDVSHMGILEGLLSEAGIASSDRGELVSLIESKNLHTIRTRCAAMGVASDMIQRICTLTELYLPIEEALPVLKSIVIGEQMQSAYDHLEELCNLFIGSDHRSRMFLDFSIVSDVNYYDGLCFKGFINGIPESVLSGGRYDPLLSKLGKKMGAIGFAVYLDRLERMESERSLYDVDTVILYDGKTKPSAVIKAQARLTDEGKSVMTVTKLSETIRFRELMNLTNGGK